MARNSDELDELFDEKQFAKIMLKSKYRNILRITIVTVLVGSIIFGGNVLICNYFAYKAYEKAEEKVILQVPNGYLSDISTKIGFLNVQVQYTISKYLGYKNVALENHTENAGLYHTYSEKHRWKIIEDEGWPLEQWENGSRKMMFFHPDIVYKSYKQDLILLPKMSKGQIMELGLSFDKAYSLDEIQTLLKDYHIQWLWLDTYTEPLLEKMQNEVKEKSINKGFILEDEVVGVKLWKDDTDSYEEVMKHLKGSKEKKYQQVYKALQDKNYTTLRNAKFLGVVILGTEEEVEKLKGNEHIKAVSLGTTANKY